MKPRFSLTLSHEGIGLLHRSKTGWSKVDEVALDDPNLGQALRVMRDTASALEGGGVLTRLVLPESQILYTTIPLGDGDPVAEIGHALEGMTPYKQDEITFDWERQGDSARVAAVAQETLHEAESFALEHRFNPVCFAAMPTEEQFPREPWFGETYAAAKLLPEGETLEHGDTPDPAPKVQEPAPVSELPAPAALPDPAPAPKAQPTPPTPPESPAPAAPAPADSKETPDPKAPAVTAPLPAPETRPVFASRRDGEAPTTASAPNIAPRLHLETAAPADPPKPDLTKRNVGVTAPDAPELAPKRRPGKDAGKTKAAIGAKVLSKVKAKGKGKAKAEVTAKPPAATATASPSTAVADPPPADATSASGFKLFGADAAPPKKSPMLGLALTAVLVVVMVLVALWSMLGSDSPQEAAALLPPPVPEITAPEAQPDTQIAARPTGDAPATIPEPAALPEGAAAPEIVEAPEPVAPPTPEQALAAYATSGIWMLSPTAPQPSGQDVLDDLYIASLDPTVSVQDAIALPPAAIDTPPGVSANPPAQGDRFALDAQGLVSPSPRGTMNPEGVLIYAGQPPLVPPARPATAKPDPVQQAEVAAAQALADKRPRARPDNLAEQNERANLGGRSRTELATLRPKARPVSAQQQAAAASVANIDQQDTPAPDIAANTEAEPQEVFSNSKLAVAVSRNPAARPSNFARTVEKAQQEQARSAASVPAEAKMTPSIPSSASVAKQATLPNAINLRKVNLIGVYGANADRRALVRLKSGRYVKVKVGDRVDGGRVTAISDSELHYQKGNRNVVLKLPRG